MNLTSQYLSSLEGKSKGISKIFYLSVEQNTFLLVSIVLATVLIVGITNINGINILGVEIEEIAEQDITLTNSVSIITINQLEEAMILSVELDIMIDEKNRIEFTDLLKQIDTFEMEYVKKYGNKINLEMV